jgi:hypothetical protein
MKERAKEVSWPRHSVGRTAKKENHLMKHTTRTVHLFAILTVLLLLTAGVASAGAPPLPYFNGFEENIDGWDFQANPAFHAARVASATNGVTSATGGWHAEGGTNNGTVPVTNWGGYSSVFPANGYSTAVDIYLNFGGGYTNDTRFDFTSAINTPAGNHRRDFAFNAGFYNDNTAPGSGNRFIISASNNTGRANSFPANPGRNPIAITTTGWYTFKHTFRDNGSGVLAVDLTVADSAGTVLGQWTLSDASDVIGVTVGGNRYGWFASIEFPFLAFDNSARSGAVPQTKDDCKNGGWQFVGRPDGTPFKNQGDCIQFVNTGK